MTVNKRTRLNEGITVPEVRLIDVSGEQVGIVALKKAQSIADEADLDLVEIVPRAEPPVCRIMDYGKYLFNLNKKKNTAKKRQKQIQVKEVKLRPSTKESDYQVKLRNLNRFLAAGDKVKVTLRFRGREMVHQELGIKMLKRIEQDLAGHSVVEQLPKLEGKQMAMVLSPKK